MLTEVIVYIAIFVLVFSCVFAAIFQMFDFLMKLHLAKDKIDELYFLRAQLGQYFEQNLNWEDINEDELLVIIREYVSSKTNLNVLSRETIETTRGMKILFLNLQIENEIYKFSYIQKKQ